MPGARTSRLLAALAAAALACSGAAGAGAAASHAERGAVSPRSGGPRTQFTVAFTTPIATGAIGRSVVYEALAATDASAARPGCDATVEASAPFAKRGGRVTARLAATGSWCAGRYGLRVLEVRAPLCYLKRTCARAGVHETGSFALTRTFAVR